MANETEKEPLYLAVGYGLNCNVVSGGVELKGVENLVPEPVSRKDAAKAVRNHIEDAIVNLDDVLGIRVTSYTSSTEHYDTFIVTDETPREEELQALFARLENGDADIVELKPDEMTPNVYMIVPVVDKNVFA